MTKLVRFVTLCALAIAVWLLLESQAPAEPRQDRCVILVSVDGLANFYLDDPRADMPTVRRLAREGARARGGMVCSFPTVTWPNHVTLVTGTSPAKHGVIGNSYLDRATGKPVSLLPDPLLDKDQIVKTPTVYDAAHRAGLKTAGVIWPATRNARTLDWTVPDMAGDEAWPKFGTASWLAELRAADLPVDRHGTWVREPGGGVQRDWLYVRLARHVLQTHAPNLLLIHLVEPDHVQHRHGPRSPESYWCMSYADDRIRDLVEAVEKSPRAGKTTIFVCGDHGFLTIDREIRPNVVLRRLGLTDAGKAAGGSPAAYCLSQGGSAMVYVLDEPRRGQIAEKLRKALADAEGIEAVLGPDEFARLGQPTRREDPHAPDLWLAAKPGFSFSDAAGGEEVVVARSSAGGTHGYLPDQPDLLSACVVWGPGVKAGTDLGKIDIRDVAPSMAGVLGVELSGAEGKRLPAVADR